MPAGAGRCFTIHFSLARTRPPASAAGSERDAAICSGASVGACSMLPKGAEAKQESRRTSVRPSLRILSRDMPRKVVRAPPARQAHPFRWAVLQEERSARHVYRLQEQCFRDLGVKAAEAHDPVVHDPLQRRPPNLLYAAIYDDRQKRGR